MRKFKVPFLILSAIWIASCGTPKNVIQERMVEYFTNHEVDFKKLKKDLFHLLDQCHIVHIGNHVVSDSMIINLKEGFGKVEEISLDQSCIRLAGVCHSQLGSLKISEVYIKDSSIVFSLKNSFGITESDLYFFYTNEISPSFQEIDFNDSLISHHNNGRWAYKIATNWFLVVLKKEL